MALGIFLSVLGLGGLCFLLVRSTVYGCQCSLVSRQASGRSTLAPVQSGQ
jgi:hypothetical protein